MTDDPAYKRLLEQAWRGKLTPDQQAELDSLLAAHPETRADWEVECGLDALLNRLPNAPVPSNFTARVLREIDRPEVARRPRAWFALVAWRRLLPRIAAAALLVGTGVFTYHEARDSRRVRLAESVAAISEVSSLPGPEILRDFDAIQAMNPTPPADEQLLALLKE